MSNPRSDADDRAYADVSPLFDELASLPPGDPRRPGLRERLIEAYLPLARHISNRFRNRGEREEDLLQVARLGLVHAVDRFDPERRSNFLSFAVPTIMGEVRRYFRDSGWGVHVPRGLQERSARVSAAGTELTHRQRRPPTPSEIAAHLGISLDDVHEALDVAGAYAPISLDQAISPDADATSLADMIAAEDTALAGVVDRQTVRPLLRALPERSRRILYLRFFRELSQSQIGAEVGLSQMQVSRILAATLEQLRAGMPAENAAGHGAGDPAGRQ
ncbi:MAG: SigB/SigF/SigG family RNA polymerase sigma factor [Mycobacteriales bacterium]|nr:MAG: B/F/G family RNA polymerase sigma-70 factor [Pseudonocardiales bacterium]